MSDSESDEGEAPVRRRWVDDDDSDAEEAEGKGKEQVSGGSTTATESTESETSDEERYRDDPPRYLRVSNADANLLNGWYEQSGLVRGGRVGWKKEKGTPALFYASAHARWQLCTEPAARPSYTLSTRARLPVKGVWSQPMENGVYHAERRLSVAFHEDVSGEVSVALAAVCFRLSRDASNRRQLAAPSSKLERATPAVSVPTPKDTAGSTLEPPLTAVSASNPKGVSAPATPGQQSDAAVSATHAKLAAGGTAEVRQPAAFDAEGAARVPSAQHKTPTPPQGGPGAASDAGVRSPRLPRVDAEEAGCSNPPADVRTPPLAGSEPAHPSNGSDASFSIRRSNGELSRSPSPSHAPDEKGAHLRPVEDGDYARTPGAGREMHSMYHRTEPVGSDRSYESCATPPLCRDDATQTAEEPARRFWDDLRRACEQEQEGERWAAGVSDAAAALRAPVLQGLVDRMACRGQWGADGEAQLLEACRRGACGGGGFDIFDAPARALGLGGAAAGTAPAERLQAEMFAGGAAERGSPPRNGPGEGRRTTGGAAPAAGRRALPAGRDRVLTTQPPHPDGAVFWELGPVATRDEHGSPAANPAERHDSANSAEEGAGEEPTQSVATEDGAGTGATAGLVPADFGASGVEKRSFGGAPDKAAGLLRATRELRDELAESRRREDSWRARFESASAALGQREALAKQVEETSAAQLEELRKCNQALHDKCEGQAATCSAAERLATNLRTQLFELEEAVHAESLKAAAGSAELDVLRGAAGECAAAKRALSELKARHAQLERFCAGLRAPALSAKLRAETARGSEVAAMQRFDAASPHSVLLHCVNPVVLTPEAAGRAAIARVEAFEYLETASRAHLQHAHAAFLTDVPPLLLQAASFTAERTETQSRLVSAIAHFEAHFRGQIVKSAVKSAARLRASALEQSESRSRTTIEADEAASLAAAGGGGGAAAARVESQRAALEARAAAAEAAQAALRRRADDLSRRAVGLASENARAVEEAGDARAEAGRAAAAADELAAELARVRRENDRLAAAALEAETQALIGGRCDAAAAAALRTELCLVKVEAATLRGAGERLQAELSVARATPPAPRGAGGTPPDAVVLKARVALLETRLIEAGEHAQAADARRKLDAKQAGLTLARLRRDLRAGHEELEAARGLASALLDLQLGEAAARAGLRESALAGASELASEGLWAVPSLHRRNLLSPLDLSSDGVNGDDSGDMRVSGLSSIVCSGAEDEARDARVLRLRMPVDAAAMFGFAQSPDFAIEKAPVSCSADDSNDATVRRLRGTSLLASGHSRDAAMHSTLVSCSEEEDEANNTSLRRLRAPGGTAWSTKNRDVTVANETAAFERSEESRRDLARQVAAALAEKELASRQAAVLRLTAEEADARSRLRFKATERFVSFAAARTAFAEATAAALRSRTGAGAAASWPGFAELGVPEPLSLSTLRSPASPAAASCSFGSSGRSLEEFADRLENCVASYCTTRRLRKMREQKQRLKSAGLGAPYTEYTEDGSAAPFT
ncbi:hypothetical protein DIPPA_17666 [Diplonema papillatum]|nr:hypothetical protein DIPPA_17666 [Diplonema papillatum]